jgi:hypothetical protein
MDEGIEKSAEELSENGRMWKSWVMVGIVLITWVVAASVQWGLASGHAQDTDRRVGVLESEMERKIDRAEYDARQNDIIERLTRIENKIDRGR